MVTTCVYKHADVIGSPVSALITEYSYAPRKLPKLRLVHVATFCGWLEVRATTTRSSTSAAMSQAAVNSGPSGRGIVGSDFERAKERIARRRRAKDGDGSSDGGDVCPSVEDAAPNTSSHARGNSSDEDTSVGAAMSRRRCCNVCAWTEAPAWAVHNRYIHSGYRTGGGYYGALRSVRPRPARADPSSSLNPASTFNYSLFHSSPSFETLSRRINNADYRADLPCNVPLEYELDATPPACTPYLHRNLPIGGWAEHKRQILFLCVDTISRR